MTERDQEQHGGVTGGPPEAGGSRRPCVLTINGGSSSLKFAVFAASESLDRVLTGRVERVGQGESRLVVSAADGGRREDRAVAAPDQAAAAGLVIEEIERGLGLGHDRGRRAPHRPRCRPIRRAGPHHRGDDRPAPADRPLRPGTPAGGDRADRGDRQRRPGHPPGRVFRHGIPPRDAEARTDRSDPAEVLGAGSQALRFPRTVVQLSHGRTDANRPVRRRPRDGSCWRTSDRARASPRYARGGAWRRRWGSHRPPAW